MKKLIRKGAGGIKLLRPIVKALTNASSIAEKK